MAVGPLSPLAFLVQAPQLLAALRKLHAAIQDVVLPPARPIRGPRKAGDELEDALAEDIWRVHQVEGTEP